MIDARILVVGGGVAGLAAARTLASAGFAAEVVEREPAWDGAGTGIYLPGNAFRALRGLGLEQAVLERGIVIPWQRVSDHRGRLLVEVDVAALWDGVGPCVALQRADLHDVLLDGARDAPIRMGVEVRQLRDEGEAVAVEFGDGSAGEFDLVIGADGIRSAVRRLTFGDQAAARPVGQVGWRFVTACPPAITSWSVMLGHRTAFLMIPIGNGSVYCYCDVVSRSGEGEHEDLDRLFSGFAEPAPSLIDSLLDRAFAHRAAIGEVALETWVRGRVLLIGDAAHATSPNMAEGAAMALEDALVLAECLQRSDAVPLAWRRSRPVAGRERTGFVRRRIAGTELATCRRRSETRSYAPSAKGSSDRTTDLCSTRPKEGTWTRIGSMWRFRTRTAIAQTNVNSYGHRK